MTDEAAFTAALEADPDDDVCRGAFADWLTDNAGTWECPNCTDRISLMQTPHAYENVMRYCGPRPREKCPVCDNTRAVPDDRLDRAYYHRARIAVKPVLADPDDDDARLAFADWADGQGRYDRAELIRAQIELAAKPPCPDWCDHDPAKCRVTALEREVQRLVEAAKRDVWCGIPQFELVHFAYTDIRTAGEWWRGCVHKGFVETVLTTGPAWVEHAAHLLAHNPITHAFLVGAPDVERASQFMYRFVPRGAVVPPMKAYTLDGRWVLPRDTHRIVETLGVLYWRRTHIQWRF